MPPSIAIAHYNANGNKGDEELTEQAIAVARELGATRPGVFVEPSGPPYVPGSGECTSVRGFVRYPWRGEAGSRVDVLGYVVDVATLTVALALGRAARWAPIGRRRRRALRDIAGFDYVLFKGGGYCHAYGAWRDAAALLYLLHLGLLCRRLGTPYSFLPNSYGPFATPGTPLLMKAVLRGADRVYARETVSQEVVEGLDPALAVTTSPDMAFGIRPDPTPKVKALFTDALAGHDEATPVVGITARPVRSSEAGAPAEQHTTYVDSLRAAIRRIRAAGGTPLLVTHVWDENEREDDRVVLRELVEVDGITTPWVNDRSLTARELAALYGLCDLLVATRFHSVIFAASSGTPSVVIRYGGNKSLGTLRDMDLDAYSLPLTETTPERLVAVLDTALRDREEISRRLDEWATTIAGANDAIVTALVPVVTGR